MEVPVAGGFGLPSEVPQLEVTMRRLSTIVLVAAAAVAVTLTTGGSAYAGGTQAPTVTPSYSSPSVNIDDDMMGGCHRAHQAADVDPIEG